MNFSISNSLGHSLSPWCAPWCFQIYKVEPALGPPPTHLIFNNTHCSHTISRTVTRIAITTIALLLSNSQLHSNIPCPFTFQLYPIQICKSTTCSFSVLLWVSWQQFLQVDGARLTISILMFLVKLVFSMVFWAMLSMARAIRVLNSMALAQAVNTRTVATCHRDAHLWSSMNVLTRNFEPMMSQNPNCNKIRSLMPKQIEPQVPQP